MADEQASLEIIEQGFEKKIMSKHGKSVMLPREMQKDHNGSPFMKLLES